MLAGKRQRGYTCQRFAQAIRALERQCQRSSTVELWFCKPGVVGSNPTVGFVSLPPTGSATRSVVVPNSPISACLRVEDSSCRDALRVPCADTNDYAGKAVGVHYGIGRHTGRPPHHSGTQPKTHKHWFVRPGRHCTSSTFTDSAGLGRAFRFSSGLTC